jgi:hypothetical protein
MTTESSPLGSLWPERAFGQTIDMWPRSLMIKAGREREVSALR